MLATYDRMIYTRVASSVLFVNVRFYYSNSCRENKLKYDLTPGIQNSEFYDKNY